MNIPNETSTSVPSGPTNDTFQLVLTGFWACLLYEQHCFQYYLQGIVVLLTVIHENAGLFAGVRLELEVQQSFSFPLLLQTLISAISKCV